MQSFFNPENTFFDFCGSSRVFQFFDLNMFFFISWRRIKTEIIDSHSFLTDTQSRRCSSVQNKNSFKKLSKARKKHYGSK